MKLLHHASHDSHLVSGDKRGRSSYNGTTYLKRGTVGSRDTYANPKGVTVDCCIFFQLRKALSQLQRISAAGANGLICSPAPTVASKSACTQTEFPAAMLEDYVVKNRKRILKLLGIVQPQGSGGELIHTVHKTDMSKSRRIGCVIPRFKLHRGITQPIP